MSFNDDLLQHWYPLYILWIVYLSKSYLPRPPNNPESAPASTFLNTPIHCTHHPTLLLPLVTPPPTPPLLSTKKDRMNHILQLHLIPIPPLHKVLRIDLILPNHHGLPSIQSMILSIPLKYEERYKKSWTPSD